MEHYLKTYSQEEIWQFLQKDRQQKQDSGQDKSSSHFNFVCVNSFKIGEKF